MQLLSSLRRPTLKQDEDQERRLPMAASDRHRRSAKASSNQLPKIALVMVLCAGVCLAQGHQKTAAGNMSLPTELRVAEPGWWPTKGKPARDEYVGAQVCAKCHAEIAATYQNVPMRQAALPASAAEIFRQPRPLSLQLGPFAYRFLTKEDTTNLSISDENSSASRAIEWSFGEGDAGQTYLYQQDQKFYEAHLSYFRSINGLDITPGQIRTEPENLESAFGRRLSSTEARQCFGCHTTASTVNEQFDPAQATPGVTCEQCHGPGAKHVAAMSLGMETEKNSQTLNPARLSAVDSVDFCGACHRTWEDVAASGFANLGVFNVRFAPYRLENSRCWGRGDARLTCLACHDPHKPLVADSASYDGACLRCHILRGAKVDARHPGAACSVATANCVTCHMAKYEPAGLHRKFTDHWIRVVRAGQPYPN